MTDEISKEKFKTACRKIGGKFKKKKGIYGCKAGKNSLIYERHSGDATLKGKGVKGKITNAENIWTVFETAMYINNARLNWLKLKKPSESLGKE